MENNNPNIPPPGYNNPNPNQPNPYQQAQADTSKLQVDISKLQVDISNSSAVLMLDKLIIQKQARLTRLELLDLS